MRSISSMRCRGGWLSPAAQRRVAPYFAFGRRPPPRAGDNRSQQQAEGAQIMWHPKDWRCGAPTAAIYEKPAQPPRLRSKLDKKPVLYPRPQALGVVGGKAAAFRGCVVRNRELYKTRFLSTFAEWLQLLAPNKLLQTPRRPPTARAPSVPRDVWHTLLRRRAAVVGVSTR